MKEIIALKLELSALKSQVDVAQQGAETSNGGSLAKTKVSVDKKQQDLLPSLKKNDTSSRDALVEKNSDLRCILYGINCWKNFFANSLN